MASYSFISKFANDSETTQLTMSVDLDLIVTTTTASSVFNVRSPLVALLWFETIAAGIV